MHSDEIKSLSNRLSDALHLQVNPIGIGFFDTLSKGVGVFDEDMPKPASDGRTGRVSAGCVFWMKSTNSSFVTQAKDHYNCSVGSLTHGLVDFSQVASNNDIAELVSSGWVSPQMVPTIPVVSKRHKYINYGPLSEAAFDPDVVLLRLNARQLMIISDAIKLDIQGKPQCHIVALAKEHNKVAASVGCALSRARTGMSPNEMTCAIPFGRFEEIVNEIEKSVGIDSEVAKYAASDSRRFSGMKEKV